MNGIRDQNDLPKSTPISIGDLPTANAPTDTATTASAAKIYASGNHSSHQSANDAPSEDSVKCDLVMMIFLSVESGRERWEELAREMEGTGKRDGRHCKVMERAGE